jgi:hypothetical protein
MKHLVTAALFAGLTFAPATAFAHPHIVSNPSHDQALANGQNHPGFVGNVSCEGVNEPAGSGPAGYGLETAHHGPDSGTPGKGDGCYQRDAPPDDQNPAID